MKKSAPFYFKEFVVHHDRCSMKVGTDAVLLGSWVNVRGAKKILDIGTGSGVIALMLAQRTGANVTIDAIEIEEDDALQAKENVMRSAWHERISVYKNSIQEYQPRIKYDLIVSNPPYFNNSLLPPTAHRARTRHTEQLTYVELISQSIRLLNPMGLLSVIMPVKEGDDFMKLALTSGLYVQRQLAFYSRREKPQERWLFEFGFANASPSAEKLVLYEKGSAKSVDYENLTKDFYL